MSKNSIFWFLSKRMLLPPYNNNKSYSVSNNKKTNSNYKKYTSIYIYFISLG